MNRMNRTGSFEGKDPQLAPRYSTQTRRQSNSLGGALILCLAILIGAAVVSALFGHDITDLNPSPSPVPSAPPSQVDKQ